jgi:hypothetical protein
VRYNCFISFSRRDGTGTRGTWRILPTGRCVCTGRTGCRRRPVGSSGTRVLTSGDMTKGPRGRDSPATPGCQLPDGRVIKVGSERYEAPECMFQPHLVDVEQPGVAGESRPRGPFVTGASYLSDPTLMTRPSGNWHESGTHDLTHRVVFNKHGRLLAASSSC